jgi:ribosomal-protein-alanine N-acetyltransferase
VADLDRIETGRLVLTRVTVEHLPFLAVMWQDPDVVVTLGGPRDRDAVAATVDRWGAHWDRFGYGAYVVADRETGTCAGWAGLMCTDTGGVGGTELLYALAPAWRGRGFATEAGDALLDVAFGALGLETVVAYTLPHNRGSRAVMERLGFVYDGEVEHAGLTHVLYRRRRDASSGAATTGSEGDGGVRRAG